MGIHGLLPFLKPVSRRCNIKDFSGKTVGVDAMCWMHKGAFACSTELVLGQDTDKFVHYFLRMCETLRFHSIKPVIVFDGARLPAKAKEEGMRQESRESARQEAMQLLERKRRGEQVDERALASKCEGAIKITTEMISRLMSALRELRIHFIVAPFEADAQLAYMCRTGWVHSVISEDSDLLAYGCPNTIFKFDKYGEGENIALPCLQPDAKGAVEDAPSAGPVVVECDADEEEKQSSPEKGPDGRSPKGRGRGRGRGRGKPAAAAPEDKDFTAINSWTPERFVEFCVLCGTDYKEHDVHIKGLGIKTAFKYLCGFRNVEAMIGWMVEDKRWRDKLSCSMDEYLKRFRTVVTVFWHHFVFDPRRGECISIASSFPDGDRRLPQGIDLASLCGQALPRELAVQVARGEVDARTREPRSQAKLTPAERSILDRILAQKRGDQRQYEFDQSLRADAKRIAELKAAAAAQQEQATQQPAPPAPAQPPAAAAAPADTEGGDDAGEDEPMEQAPPREMCLLPGDIAAIMAMKEAVLDERTKDAAPDAETPPRRSSPAAETPSNPFVRKRAAKGMTVVTKRPRLVSSTRDKAASEPAGRPAQVEAPSAAAGAAKPTMPKVEEHPRGGGAARDAAEIVLMQCGVYQREQQVAERKERGKLTSFFRMAQAPRAPAPAADEGEKPPQKPSGLAAWKARPWEVEEEDEAKSNPFTVGKNMLSLQRPVWRIAK